MSPSVKAQKNIAQASRDSERHYRPALLTGGRTPGTAVQTGNMVYIVPGNRARRLVQASGITPPLRGSRRDKGAARSRSGGGPARHPLSETQQRAGGAAAVPPPHQPSPFGSASATPPQGGSDYPRERGRPARNPIPRWRLPSVGTTLRAGSRPFGVIRNGESQVTPRRRCRSNRVAETGEAVPGHGAGGTPAFPGGAQPAVDPVGGQLGVP